MNWPTEGGYSKRTDKHRSVIIMEGGSAMPSEDICTMELN